ncbi:hypothetical protein RAS1_32370 [Phycisphaerae bacterium RAS1]|nr:hypothetical protein RAS1_32370 [Phycisphaerae bacterium RAS1]
MRGFLGLVTVLAVPALALADRVLPTNRDYIPAPAGAPQIEQNAPGFNGFEAPFVVGPINTQQGWTTFTANQLAPVISTANPAGPTQHLRLALGPGTAGSFNGAFSPDIGNFVNKPSEVSVDIAINSPGGADAHLVGQAPSQSLLTWRVNFSFNGTINVLDDADGLPGGSLAFIPTVPWTPGVYKTLRVESIAPSGPNTGQLRYYYDGNLIYTSSAGHYAGTAVEQVILFGDNFYNNAQESIDYDNLNWTPEPASLALLGLGALVLRRR